ncbi:sugar ABC transporter permease [Planctomycetota bacterium]|nr:sugar ABC transporter permease [Planctomycetota bacterium]
MKRDSGGWLASVVLHAVLIGLAVAAITPLVWLVLTALKPKADLATVFVTWDGLGRLGLHNFSELFAKHALLAWMLNSLFLACTQTVLTVLLACLGGFALAKHRFAGKRILLWIMLATMMLPAQAMLPASYELMWKLGWLNTWQAILVPCSVSVFGMLLFRGAFAAVPDELLQAARIDGAGEFRLWWDIAVPCVRPMIGAFSLLAFTGAWNAFIWPQVILSDSRSLTLPIAATALMGTAEGETNFGLVMAITVIGIAPVLVLFFALQRDFVAGLTSGAVKG